MLPDKYRGKGWFYPRFADELLNIFPDICFDPLGDFASVYYARIRDFGKRFHQTSSLVRDRELVAQFKNISFYFFYPVGILRRFLKKLPEIKLLL